MSGERASVGEPAGDRAMAPTGERAAPPPKPPEEPAVCGHCGDRFADDRLLALHRGRAHQKALTDAEVEAYREARADERDDLRLFRIKALGLLLLIYFGFIYVYAFVL